MKRDSQFSTVAILFTLMLTLRGPAVANPRKGAGLPRNERLAVGKVGPNFEAIDQFGKKFKLSEYKGKVVVIDFWEHW